MEKSLSSMYKKVFYYDNECIYFKSLDGWTFALSSYYEQNITKYLDDVYFQLLSIVIDPYSKYNLLFDYVNRIC